MPSNFLACSQPDKSAKKKQIPDLGKPALITGASSGLGRELAVLFSESGHVILSGRSAIELDRTRRMCKDPANVTVIAGDLLNPETLNRFVSFADLYGLHYLVCCAGEYIGGTIQTVKKQRIQDVIDTNLTAVIRIVHTLYPKLAAQLDGTIVHVNSLAGKLICQNEMVYSASKWGARAFFGALRLDARKHNVRVLEAYPGAIQTPMTEGRDNYDKLMLASDVAKAIYYTATSEFLSLQVEEIHLGRLAT